MSDRSDFYSCNGIALVAAQSGSGSPEPGCFFGPEEFFDRLHTDIPSTQLLPFDHIVENATGHRMEALPGLVQFNTELAAVTFSIKSQNQFPIVVGGDHSCAVGTWSGVSAALGERIGLLWIDAHMDAHTPETTESGAVHGMPLAALLGMGSSDLCGIGGFGPKLDAERTVLFGIRSFEPGEADNLTRHGVRIYKIDEIEQRGFEICWREAVKRVQGPTTEAHFGVTLDLDGLDPADCPGVGSPVEKGLRQMELLPALAKLSRVPGFTAFEMVEYNPEFEEAAKTYEVMRAIFAGFWIEKRPTISVNRPAERLSL